MDNYPAGAKYDPRAPWNEVQLKPMAFYKEVTETLVKTCAITTTDYEHIVDREDGETIVEDVPNYYLDWEDEYKEQYIGIAELLEELKVMARRELEKNPPREVRAHLKKVIRSCEGWELNDLDIS